MTNTSLWQSTLPAGLRRHRPPLRGRDQADVCVVGAGFTGLWTAYHLLRADPGRSVLLLDAGHVGYGASGRNGGWCSALFPLSTAALVRRHGTDAAVAMRRACQDVVDDVLATAAAEGIDCAAAKGGTIVLSRTAAGLRAAQAEVAEAATFGVDRLDLLDAAAADTQLRAVGTLGATYTPDCARVNPGVLVHGLAAVVERLGGRIAEGTRVTAIAPGRVQTNRGSVTCDQVVRATEGFTPTIAGSREIVPVYSLVLATPPLSQAIWDEIGLDRGQTFAEHQHLIVYGQRTADNRLVFGGRGAPYHLRSAISPRFDQDAEVHRSLARSLMTMFPALAGAARGRQELEGLQVDYTWGGALGIPRDWHPSVRYHSATGIGCAGGYVGDGVALAKLAGATLADLLTDRQTERTRLPWVGHRSPNWEREPLRWLGVNAGLGLAKLADAGERVTGRPGLLGSALARLTGG